MARTASPPAALPHASRSSVKAWLRGLFGRPRESTAVIAAYWLGFSTGLLTAFVLLLAIWSLVRYAAGAG